MLWIKKFRKKKLQSLMIFLMTLICALLMAGSLQILTSLQEPYHDLYVETGAPGLKVYPVLNPEVSGKNWIEALLELEPVEKVYQVNRHYVTEKMEVDGEELEAFASAVEYQKELHSHVRLLEGSMDQLTDKECFVASVIAAEKDIQIGDVLSLYYGEKKYDYTVRAIYADCYNLNLAFQTEILLKELPEEYENQPYYSVFVREGFDTEAVTEEYLAQNEGMLDGNFYTAESNMANASITESILGGILLMLAVVIFLVTTMMIRYMIRNALLKDRKTIAVYKAIGYTDSQIRGIYMIFYQMITFGGSAAGVLLSPMLSDSFMKNAYANLGVEQSYVNVLQGIGCVLLMNALAALQVYRELCRVKKMKPVDILTGNEENLGIKKVQNTKVQKTGFSPLQMAMRMMQRDLKNTIIIVVTCILSIYIVNIGVACFGNIGNMMEDNYYWLGFDDHDITIRSGGNPERFYEICEEIQNLTEVKALVRRNLDKGISVPYSNFVSGMVYENYDEVDIPMTEGRSPQNPYEVVAGGSYLKEMDKSIGDYLEIYLDGEKKVNLLIVGSYQGFYNMGRGIRLNGQVYEKENVEISYPEASVYLQEDEDAAACMEKLESRYGDEIEVMSRRDLYKNILDIICEPQKAALGPFVVLAVLIGGINLFYVIYLKNVSSQKTFSIYKSIGYCASHLVKMNGFYVGVICLISMLVTIPLFYITFPKMMLLVMSMFGFREYPVVVEPMAILLGNGMVVLIFVLGAVLSSIQLYKNNISELIGE